MSDYASHYPNARKIYKQGTRPGVRVAFREIHLNPTRTAQGEVHENAPVCVYDTSGLWTDPAHTLDVEHGLPALRADWIAERADTEVVEGRSYTPLDDGPRQRRERDPFSGLKRETRVASRGGCVTQMYYARRGVITPEMEYVAIRENLGAHNTSGSRNHLCSLSACGARPGYRGVRGG